MITKIASRLTIFLVNRGIVSREDIPIYTYGYEALFASVVNFIVIMTLGLIFHQGWHSVVFFVVFALTRIYSGGYHAQSYLKCNLVLGGIYVLTVVLNQAQECTNASYEMLIFVLFYLTVILKFAPVPDSRKQLTKAERMKFREKVLFLSAIWTILIAIFYFVNFNLAFNVAITLFVVAVLIVIQHLCKGEEGNRNEESS
ncbi:accessory gene regulator ArgB-like protein [Anaerosporobacter faecicola]|uniref:accessory gene regulator ArgB-like protein n=1 Tax=Anaerosporobacter faecicola TaxID=2718714 RepID=UPI00143B1268|nr:accessory gene regulator B family protein [Anaerosporobacter faecicola]